MSEKMGMSENVYNNSGGTLTSRRNDRDNKRMGKNEEKNIFQLLGAAAEHIKKSFLSNLSQKDFFNYHIESAFVRKKKIW